MRVARGLIGLGSSFTLLASVGCATVSAPEVGETAIEPAPATSQQLDRHVIKHGDYSVELNCADDRKIEAELFRGDSRQADYEYDLSSFSRKFAKHMRNLDRFDLIPKETRKAIVGRVEQISGLCDGP